MQTFDSKSSAAAQNSSAQKYRARFEDKIDYNAKYGQYSFELIEPHRINFKAGQYLSLKVTEAGLRRSYSLFNEPRITNQVDLLVDVSPGGPGSKFFQNLKFGQEVNFLAPLGEFIIDDNLPENINHLYFIATGSGVAPFKSMIEDQLRNKQDQRQLTLHWGMRYAHDLFWLDRWQELTETFANFHFHPVLSKAPDAWNLCRGRVTDCLQVHEQAPQAAYYICGSNGMIDDVKRDLIGQGVDQDLIFYEKYY